MVFVGNLLFVNYTRDIFKKFWIAEVLKTRREVEELKCVLIGNPEIGSALVFHIYLGR